MGFLVPKVYFGVKTMCKKFHKVCSLGCDLGHGPSLTIFTQASNAVTAVKEDLSEMRNIDFLAA